MKNLARLLMWLVLIFVLVGCGKEVGNDGGPGNTTSNTLLADLVGLWKDNQDNYRYPSFGILKIYSNGQIEAKEDPLSPNLQRVYSGTCSYSNGTLTYIFKTCTEVYSGTQSPAGEKGTLKVQISGNDMVWTSFSGLTVKFNKLSSASGPDNIPPSMPLNVRSTATYSPSEVNIYWSASTDNVGVTGYKVYLKNMSTGMTGDTTGIPITKTSFSIGVPSATNWCFRVTAHDAAGNESEKSGQTCASTVSPGGPGGGADSGAIIGSWTCLGYIIPGDISFGGYINFTSSGNISYSGQFCGSWFSGCPNATYNGTYNVTGNSIYMTINALGHTGSANYVWSLISVGRLYFFYSGTLEMECIK